MSDNRSGATGRGRRILVRAGFWLAGAALAAVFFLAPARLGEWIGRRVTGEDTSQLGTVLSWSLEAGWITFLVLLAAGLVRQARDGRRDRDRRAGWEAVAREQAAVRRQKHQYTEALANLQTLRRLLLLGDGLTGMTRLTFADCALVEPRAAHRNGPRVPTVVDTGGRVEISHDAIVYRGAERQETWEFDHLQQVMHAADHVAIAVGNRKSVSGVLLPPAFRAVFTFAVDARRHGLTWTDQVSRRFNAIETELVRGLEASRGQESGVPV
ncbi:hypothetical protein KIH74_05195 [Kineosporia sp. J2-2]|uniref:NERD domain-containing protein n=1 Tax=Kineosporia corallincola TaxID=2835133 RepID=A0ABS5TB49_9ACTN|nr:hypothetical protein [Kineosporia corallincola]MBT0768307.1 hypothetical protein [Kineosporia corallincola]